MSNTILDEYCDSDCPIFSYWPNEVITKLLPGKNLPPFYRLSRLIRLQVTISY